MGDKENPGEDQKSRQQLNQVQTVTSHKKRITRGNDRLKIDENAQGRRQELSNGEEIEQIGQKGGENHDETDAPKDPLGHAAPLDQVEFLNPKGNDHEQAQQVEPFRQGDRLVFLSEAFDQDEIK